MRAIASGVALAQRLKLPYTLKWPVNNDLFAGFNDIFEQTEWLPVIDNISSKQDLLFCDGPRKKNLFLSPLLQVGRYGLKIDDSKLEPLLDQPHAVEQLISEVDGTILIRTGSEFYPNSDTLYRSLFKPTEAIFREAERRLKIDKGERPVGLHIRRTDNTLSILNSPDELFENAIREELETNPQTKFYLATDNEEVKFNLHRLFGDCITYSTKKADRTSRDGIIEGITEMTSLSMCSKIYGSYWSSFSEAAARIGSISLIQLKAN